MENTTADIETSCDSLLETLLDGKQPAENPVFFYIAGGFKTRKRFLQGIILNPEVYNSDWVSNVRINETVVIDLGALIELLHISESDKPMQHPEKLNKYKSSYLNAINYIVAQLLETKTNIVFADHGDDLGHTENLVKQARSSGYTTQLVVLTIPQTLLLEILNNNQSKKRGRLVDREIAVSIAKIVDLNTPKLITMFDFAQVFSTENELELIGEYGKLKNDNASFVIDETIIHRFYEALIGLP